MDNEQIVALEAVAGRALTVDVKAALEPFILIRNDVEIARLLSAGSTQTARP